MTLVDACLKSLELEDPRPKDAADFFYRRNEFHLHYEPVRDGAHAEWLLGSTTFDSPWVTIVRGTPGGDSTYFQVLGTPDRLIAEGGGVIGTLRWNWRATVLPGDFRTTVVGPGWYQLDVYEGDLVTVDDARRMLWFALADDLESLRSRAGIEAMYLK